MKIILTVLSILVIVFGAFFALEKRTKNAVAEEIEKVSGNIQENKVQIKQILKRFKYQDLKDTYKSIRERVWDLEAYYRKTGLLVSEKDRKELEDLRDEKNFIMEEIKNFERVHGKLEEDNK